MAQRREVGPEGLGSGDFAGIDPEVDRRETEGDRCIQMTSDRLWREPGRTLQDMLLSEPGSRIEGATEDVLRVVFVAVLGLLEETMHGDQADAIALRSLPRVHTALADAGLVVRDYARE